VRGATGATSFRNLEGCSAVGGTSLKVILGGGRTWDQLLEEGNQKRPARHPFGGWTEVVGPGESRIPPFHARLLHPRKLFGQISGKLLQARRKYFSERKLVKPPPAAATDPEESHTGYKAGCRTPKGGSRRWILAKRLRDMDSGKAGEGKKKKRAHKQQGKSTRAGAEVGSDSLRPSRFSDERFQKSPFLCFRPQRARRGKMKYLRERWADSRGPVPSRPNNHPPHRTVGRGWMAYKVFLGGSEGRRWSPRWLRPGCWQRLWPRQKSWQYVGPHFSCPRIADLRQGGMFADGRHLLALSGPALRAGRFAHLLAEKYKGGDQHGQILVEGDHRSGALSSFNASGTAYSFEMASTCSRSTFPTRCSGFQRWRLDLWAAAETCGAKGVPHRWANRRANDAPTGEGLQHQGRAKPASKRHAFPHRAGLRTRAYTYELAVIISRRHEAAYEDGETTGRVLPGWGRGKRKTTLHPRRCQPGVGRRHCRGML